MSQNAIRSLSPLLGLLWTAATAAAPSITVTSPAGDEAWQTTTTHNIAWTSNETTGDVKIELLKNGRLQTVVSADAPGTGAFAWLIPDGLEDASDYTVRVSALSGSATGSSPAEFSIGAKVVTLYVEPDPVEGGTTTPRGEAKRVAGIEYPMSASPSLEHSFDYWSGDAVIGDRDAAVTTVTLSDTATVTAHFTALPVLFSEDFESGLMPPNVRWAIPDSLSIPGDEPAHWTASKQYTTTSTYCAVCPWGSANLDEWLILPPLDFSLLEGPVLSFDWESSYFWSVSPHHNADFAALLSQDGGRTWQTLWSFDSIGVWPDWTWRKSAVDLADYAGSSVMIAFRVTGANNADVALDNITVRYKSIKPVVTTDIGKLKLSVTNRSDGHDSLSVTNGVIPEYAFDPNTTSSATVNLGGFSQPCHGFQRRGDNYVSQFVTDSGSRVKLTINPSKRLWSFKATKASAFGSVLFPYSTLQAFIQIDGQAYGATVAVDQKTSWSLSAPYMPWNGMYVANANGKHQSVPDGATAFKGAFNISGAYADYTGLIDPDSDTVSLKIGDWQALDQAALTKPLADALIYVHKSAAGAASPLKFWMDLDRNAWTFNASKADSSLVFGPRISFELRIGGTTWRQAVPSVQKTTLTYPRKTLPASL